MREILFRAKRTDTGEWIEFTPLGALFANPLNIEVELKTVGEYTGLTDRNGKKIFEGDIVKREFTLWHGETKKTRETQIGVVVYSNRDCGFKVEKKCNLRKPWDGDTIEVIGNVHDNPELLEGDE